MTRTIRLLGLGPIALLASSCALLQRPAPIPTTITTTVVEPVAVPCLKPGQQPRQPKRLVQDDPTPPDNLTQIVARLRAKLKEWQDSYGPTADELLTICSKLKPSG